MQDSYSLPPYKARICRLASRAFLFVAILWGIVIVPQAAVPGWTVACEMEQGCLQQPEVSALLPERTQAAIQHDAKATADLASYVSRPMVRAGLAGLVLVGEGLMVFLLLAIGLALHRLGSRENHVLAAALPWLRRGAAASLVWAIAQPLAGVVRAIMLFPAIPDDARSIPIDLTVAGPALLFAIAAYAVAWALEAGIRAERDLSSFV
jgi:hypothetical protein